VTGPFGAPFILLQTGSDETEYIIEHTDSSGYILTIGEGFGFGMVNGSLTFSSSASNRLQLSFAKLINISSVLNLRDIILHFGSTMSSFVDVTGGEVIFFKVTIKNEGVDIDTGDFVWVNPLILVNGHVNDVIIEFTSSTVENCEYKGFTPTPLPNSFETSSSIVQILNDITHTNSVKVHVNNSIFANNNFDLSLRGSSMFRFFSVSNLTGFSFLSFRFFFNFFRICFKKLYF
jgi:hypothetical protein